jgi:hypothetical protein
VVHIEKGTRGQNDNKNWHKFRKGLLTASNCKLIRCSTDQRKTASNLLAPSKLNEDQLPLAIKYGRKNEEKARNLFMKIHQFEHKYVSCLVPGLYVSDQSQYAFLVASPDGIIDCKHCGKFLIEIKCSYKFRVNDAGYALTESGACYEENSKLVLKKSHSYFYQIQGQLFITGLRRCILVAYTDKGIHCVDVDYDDEWTRTIGKLSKFHSHHYFHELKRTIVS